MPKVSVVLPIYNVEKYISKCLDSVINQTLGDIEIICVNDCSTDNSAYIVEEYMKKDNRVRLINHKENKGLGLSRNTGIYESSCSYIVFIDSDDYISNNFVEELYNTAIKYNSDIVFTNNIYTVNESTNKIKPYYHNRVSIWNRNYKKSYLEGISYFNVNTFEKENTPEYPLVVAWNKLYKKDFFLKKNLFFSDFRIAEDVDMFYRLLLYSPIMSYNNNAKYYYLQRSTSLAGNVSHTNKIPTAILDVFKNVFNNYNSINKSLLIDSNYYNFISLMHTFNNYKADNKSEFYKMCHNMLKSLNVEIDRNKHTFMSYSCYIMKTFDNYDVYIDKVEYIKEKVFKVAWWIPNITLREKYKKVMLDKLANKYF